MRRQYSGDEVFGMDSVHRRAAPRRQSRGGLNRSLLACSSLRDQVFERLSIACRGGQSRGSHELGRLAGTGGLVDPIPVRLAQSKRENNLGHVRRFILSRASRLLSLGNRGGFRWLRSLSSPFPRGGYLHGLLHGEDGGHLDPQGFPEGVWRRLLRGQVCPMLIAHAVAEVGDGRIGRAAGDLASTEILLKALRGFPCCGGLPVQGAILGSTAGFVFVSHSHPSFPAGASRVGDKQSAVVGSESRQFGVRSSSQGHGTCGSKATVSSGPMLTNRSWDGAPVASIPASNPATLADGLPFQETMTC